MDRDKMDMQSWASGVLMRNFVRSVRQIGHKGMQTAFLIANCFHKR